MVPRMDPSEKIHDQRAIVGRTVFETLIVVSCPPGKAVGKKLLPEHIGAKGIDHLQKDIAGFRIRIGPGQDLAAGKRSAGRPVVFDILHGDRFDPPGMIDQDLPVDPEFTVEPFFVIQRHFRDIPHGKQIGILQGPCLSMSDLPEIRQRPVLPEPQFIGVLIQRGDPDAVFVRRCFLGDDIHCHLGEIQIGTDACRRRDPGGSKHIAYHGDEHQTCRFHAGPSRRLFIEMQIGGGINEAVIDGVDMDVFL